MPSSYRIADPFLGFWYRFVEPNRSLLEARQIAPVRELVKQNWPQQVGGIWELLVGEVKLSIKGQEKAVAAKLQEKIRQFPAAQGRRVVPCLFHADAEAAGVPGVSLIACA